MKKKVNRSCQTKSTRPLEICLIVLNFAVKRSSSYIEQIPTYVDLVCHCLLIRPLFANVLTLIFRIAKASGCLLVVPDHV